MCIDANVNIIHENPLKCHKNIYKYTNVIKTLEQYHTSVDYDS